MLSHRKAEVSDVPSLNALINRAYRGEESKRGWTTEAHILEGQRTDEKSLAGLLHEPHTGFELIFDNQDLIGCYNFILLPEDVFYFGMLVVKPHLQGQGTGKKIMRMIDDEARSMNCKKILLKVIGVRAELISYYERRGFKLTGKSEPFPAQDPTNGRVLVENLNLLEMEKLLT